MRDHLRGVDNQVGADRVHQRRNLGQWRYRAGDIARTGNRDVVDTFAIFVDDGFEPVHVECAVTLELALAGDMYDVRGMVSVR